MATGGRGPRDGRAPGPLVLLGAVAGVVAAGAAILWFLVLSGLSGPVQFAYAAF